MLEGQIIIVPVKMPNFCSCLLVQWIGLGENLQENPIFNGKNQKVSCKFSLKPIHWLVKSHKTTIFFERTHPFFGPPPP